MNEQKLADLFSAQIDRLLGGESAADLAVGDDSSLFSLGQLLIETNFQPSPAAQATFQRQLASWFGPTDGGLSTSLFGWPKMLLMSMGAVLALIGAGLGTVVLISFVWTGALFDSSDGNRPGPAVPQSPAPSGPVVAPPTVISPEVSPSLTSTLTATRPRATSSLKDVLPTATLAVGDTIPRPTATPTAPLNNLVVTATPAGNPTSDGGDGSGDTSAAGDHDRGHGNDLDGVDEDNPGQSEGVSGGNSQNNGGDGTSPGNLIGGGGGGNSGGGNSGGGGSSNQGNNGGGNGSSQGGGKGNN